MAMNIEQGKSSPEGQALRGGMTGLDACRFGKRIQDEVAQYFAGTHFREEPDSEVIPEGLDIIHPMDGRFQVRHQDSPDLIGI
jgi:hypothetical protein